MSDDNQKYNIPAVQRSMEILEHLAFSKVPIGFEDLLKLTNIPRSTTFRILTTLEQQGYVQKIESRQATTFWRLGPAILKIGVDYLSKLDLRQEAHPVMEWLAEEADEFVQLGVFYKGKVMYIDHVKRSKPLTMYSELGTLLPINISASGMVLVSHFSREKMLEVLHKEQFTANTAATITSPVELEKQLETVRKQGFAVDEQMYAVGIRCIAAPIYNHFGDNVAAIGISGSTVTITEESLPQLTSKVIEAANRISQRLGAQDITI